ncbi:quinone oxidoreductase family protein [Chitinophaga qingshengii]|uniref:NADP-dependent oxidoreductase n=1 Tax=Chitinophaga qingshengii TaxID=1569794 RepID=A0ABR7TQP0_9BACT|nr:NADP-dependent oxidoreductase [Chitinophaga qingshengii]MBC9932295.1 NADP-dependent oxidoreductase [Chitinophaga qingshengii]
MQAIVLHGFGDVHQFHQAELPTPSFGEAELLIAIKAAAFNPIDYQMRQGRRESEHMHSPVLGRELAGIVVAAGAQTQGFAPGDEVIAAAGSKGSNGTYATHIALDYRMVAHRPPTLPFSTATAIPAAGLTAWQTFRRMQPKPEDLLFLTGAAGAVGSFLIKLLKAHGIHQLFTTAGSEQSKAALEAIGLPPAHILDYRQPGLTQRVLQASGQRYFDWAIDIAGGSISETAAEVLGLNKGYADITFLGTPRTRELLFDKGAHILNISNYAYAVAGRTAWYGENLRELTTLLNDGAIAPPAVQVVGSFSADTVKKAHTMMENNQTYGRKLVMTMD